MEILPFSTNAYAVSVLSTQKFYNLLRGIRFFENDIYPRMGRYVLPLSILPAIVEAFPLGCSDWMSSNHVLFSSSKSPSNMLAGQEDRTHLIYR